MSIWSTLMSYPTSPPATGAAQVAWMKRRPCQSLYRSVLTLGEIRKGVEQREKPRRRHLLMVLTYASHHP